MNRKALQDRLNTILAEEKTLREKYTDPSTPMPAEEATKWGKLLDDAEGVKGQLDTLKRSEGMTEWADDATGKTIPLAPGQVGKGAVVGFEDAGTSTLGGTKSGGLELIDDEGPGAVFSAKMRETLASTAYKEAYRLYLRKGVNGLGQTHVKTLQEGIDEQGGFLVPDDLLNRIIGRKPTPTRVAARTTRIPTGRDRVVMPKVNYSTDDVYTTGIRVNWTGEVPSSSTVHRVTDPKFGQIGISVYTAMLSMPLTLDMVEDSAFPIVSWASEKFRETVDIARDDIVLNGSGIGQGAGILLNPGGTDQPAVVNSGGASTITADGLLDLTWAVPEQYDENSAFVFNKTSTGKAIAKLKDAENRYLWAQFEQSGLMLPAGQRPLLGYPVLFSALMPNVAANAFAAIFGDLSGYFLVDRVGFSIQVLREVYAENNQIVLLGRVRFGGQVAEPWKMKVHKIAA
jgi:HK97 family phage major capsid protein